MPGHSPNVLSIGIALQSVRQDHEAPVSVWKPVEIEEIAIGSFDSFPLIIKTCYLSPNTGRQGLQVSVELPEGGAGETGMFYKGHENKIYMKRIIYPCCLLFVFAGCQSATDQLREAEHRFLEIVAVPEPVQLSVGTDTLFLAVLPAPEAAGEAKAAASTLQAQIQKIDTQALEDSDRQRLDILRQAVNDLVLNGVSVPVDQVCSQISDPFQRALQYNNPELTSRFLEQIPVYFTEMEQRWHDPAPHKIQDAILKADAAFDNLHQLEQQSPATLKNKFATARFALKDYIGLCQSALL